MHADTAKYPTAKYTAVQHMCCKGPIFIDWLPGKPADTLLLLKSIEKYTASLQRSFRCNFAATSLEGSEPESRKRLRVDRTASGFTAPYSKERLCGVAFRLTFREDCLSGDRERFRDARSDFCKALIFSEHCSVVALRICIVFG